DGGGRPQVVATLAVIVGFHAFPVSHSVSPSDVRGDGLWAVAGGQSPSIVCRAPAVTLETAATRTKSWSRTAASHDHPTWGGRPRSERHCTRGVFIFGSAAASG